MTGMQISTISVYVTDQNRALEFYRDKLGFEVRMDAPYEDFRWLTVAPPESPVEIVLAPVHSSAGTENEWAKRMGIFTGIIFRTDDIEATYNELSGRGVPFEGEPEQADWGGVQAFFNDRDGNGFLLVQLMPAVRP